MASSSVSATFQLGSPGQSSLPANPERPRDLFAVGAALVRRDRDRVALLIGGRGAARDRITHRVSEDSLPSGLGPRSGIAAEFGELGLVGPAPAWSRRLGDDGRDPPREVCVDLLFVLESMKNILLKLENLI